MSPRLDLDPMDSPEPAGEFDAVSPVDSRSAGVLPGLSLGLGFWSSLGSVFMPNLCPEILWPRGSPAEDGVVENRVFEGVHDSLLA